MTADNALDKAAQYSSINDWAVIAVGGDDRITFLQGQLTQDLRQLSADKTLLTAHCDAKGKTLSVFYLVQTDEQVLLIGERNGLAISVEALKKFAVFSKVTIDDVTEQRPLACADRAWVEQHFAQIPAAEHHQVHQQDGVVLVSFAQPEPHYLLIGAATSATTSKAQLWRHWQLQAGIPWITTATSGEFVPQMLNLQHLGAISFSKGCYMGQETVARTKYLGKNKRAGFLLRADEEYALQAGDTLEMPVGENWRRAGTVLGCCTLGQQTWVLAVLAKDTEIDATLRWKDQPDAHFQVQPLPYTTDED